MSNPTWYDLLDVEPTAPADKIRAAWRAAVADLDPTDRRFQRLSEAAAVLLDTQRREQYDASLTAGEGAEGDSQSVAGGLDTASPSGSAYSTSEGPGGRVVSSGEGSGGRVVSSGEGPGGRVVSSGEGSGGRVASASERIETPESESEPVAGGLDTASPSGSAYSTGGGSGGRVASASERIETPDLPTGAAASAVGDLPEPEPGLSDIEPAAVSVEHDPPIEDEAAADGRDGPRQVPLWLLAVLAVVALALVGLAAFAWTRPDPKAIESDADAAREAAERAVVPVLSYDYRTLEEGQRKAESQLTPRYRDDAYRRLFSTIKENAPETRTVITAKVVESAVVRAGEDRVEVLLLVDRPTSNKAQPTPITYEDHVTVTMARAGGGWLIDDMTT